MNYIYKPTIIKKIRVVMFIYIVILIYIYYYDIIYKLLR